MTRLILERPDFVGSESRFRRSCRAGRSKVIDHRVSRHAADERKSINQEAARRPARWLFSSYLGRIRGDVPSQWLLLLLIPRAASKYPIIITAIVYCLVTWRFAHLYAKDVGSTWRARGKSCAVEGLVRVKKPRRVKNAFSSTCESVTTDSTCGLLRTYALRVGASSK